VIPTFDIGDRSIGPGQACFIIAEAGINHNGDIESAKRLVDAAVAAGADAIKFQTFSADTLVTRAAPMAQYQVENSGKNEPQYDMLRRLELSPAAHREVIRHCQDSGIMFLSSAFDEASADLLLELGVPAFKIPSGEITNLGFLCHVARMGRPIILSTGMCGLAEVEAAVNAIEEVGHPGLSLLHCVSEYPADPSVVNLQAMRTLQVAFAVPCGYSDHTLGIEIPLAAVALGASVLEKHLTLDSTMPGPDHLVSLEPEPFQRMVSGIRKIEAAMGSGRKRPTAGERDTAAVARKSLTAVREIQPGTIITDAMLVLKRPGTGLPGGLRAQVVGRSARRLIHAGEMIALEMIG